MGCSYQRFEVAKQCSALQDANCPCWTHRSLKPQLTKPGLHPRGWSDRLIVPESQGMSSVSTTMTRGHPIIWTMVKIHMVDQCICGGKANLHSWLNGITAAGKIFWEDFFHRTPSPIRVLPSCCNNYAVLTIWRVIQSYRAIKHP